MGFCGAGRGAGAGRTLNRAHLQAFALHELPYSGHNKKMRTHIFWLFLDPDDFPCVGMLVDGRGNFRTQQWVELIEKDNRGAGIFATAALGAQLVSEFAADDQDALGVLHLAIGHDRKKARLGEVVDAGRCIGMTEHTLRSEDDEWLAPWTADLTPQQVKVLRGGGRLADLHDFLTGRLHKALDARA